MNLTDTLLIVPAREGLDVECARSLLYVQQQHPELKIAFLTGVADPRWVRNKIADYFLKSEKVHLILVDADVSFSERDWLRLQAASALPAACAAFARRDGTPEPVRRGLAFCRIDRSVFERLAPHTAGYFDEREPDHLKLDFFDHGPIDGQWYSEAGAFWRRAIESGSEIDFFDNTDVIHYGRYGFRLKVS